jgi:hypothetical protein
MANPPHSSHGRFRQLAGSVLLGAIVIAGLSTLSSVAQTSGLPLPLFWPAAGVGFAMLCTQGRSAAWALGLGVGLWATIHFPQHLGLVPVAMLATVVGQWVVWRKLQLRFAGTSQPFARQSTMLAFLKAQGLVGAPLSAGIAVAGAGLLGLVTDLAHAAFLWGALWIMELCGTLLFAPLACRDFSPNLWRPCGQTGKQSQASCSSSPWPLRCGWPTRHCWPGPRCCCCCPGWLSTPPGQAP